MTSSALVITSFIQFIETQVKFSPRVKLLFATIFVAISGLIFGLRDYSVGTDTHRYVKGFLEIETKDSFFDLLNKFGVDVGIYWLGYIIKFFTTNPSVFLSVVAILFVSVFVLANYRLLEENKYYAIVLVACFFFFYAMGLNILKSGLAVSFCLLSLSLKGWKKYLFLGLALLFHITAVVFILGLFVVRHVGKTHHYATLWICSIIIAFLGLGWIDLLPGAIKNNVMELLRLGEVNQYLLREYDYDTGFRYDFLGFSAAFLVFPYFYLRNYSDKHYEQILKLYLLLNSLFILSFFIPFSNRVGFLSWILLPYLVGLPITKINYFKPFVIPITALIFSISYIVMFL